MAFGTFRVTDKKCATCSYYQGNRDIKMNANKPFYIYAEIGYSACAINKSKQVLSNYKCLSWHLWPQIM